MSLFVDQTGRYVTLNKTPEKIISLVPSQTELLFDLGLNDEVIGITKFCIHPEEWFRSKTRVGGTKKLNIELIHQLQPDLIIANKEENVKEQIEELENHYPVWVSDVNNPESAYEMIEQIGSIIDKNQEALELTSKIKENFSRLPSFRPRPKVNYLLWHNPYMTVGGDTFIHTMIEAAGFENIFKNKARYPEITIEDLKLTGCQFLLLSSEPFPFKQKHADELQQHLPDTKIILVDGEIFSWYGSRLLKAPNYFLKLRNQFL